MTSVATFSAHKIILAVVWLPPFENSFHRRLGGEAAGPWAILVDREPRASQTLPSLGDVLPLRTNDGSESGMVELEWARLVRDMGRRTGGEDEGVSDLWVSILGTNQSHASLKQLDQTVSHNRKLGPFTPINQPHLVRT